MPTIILARAGRRWCYRARQEADLLETREYADGVTPGPQAPYTVRAWRCSLDETCNAQGLACRLSQPDDLPTPAP